MMWLRHFWGEDRSGRERAEGFLSVIGTATSAVNVDVDGSGYGYFWACSEDKSHSIL